MNVWMTRGFDSQKGKGQIYWFWDPPSLLFNRHEKPSQKYTGRNMKQTT